MPSIPLTGDEHKSLKKRKLDASNHPTLLSTLAFIPNLRTGLGHVVTADPFTQAQASHLNAGLRWKAHARAVHLVGAAQVGSLFPNDGNTDLTSLADIDVVPCVSEVISSTLQM